MLPYALKLVWFAACLSGTLVSWVGVTAVGKQLGVPWASYSICVSLSVMEGMFCLGIFWRMDPSQMPKAFCIAQTIIMHIAAYVLIGLYSSFFVATTLHVLKPKKWGNLGNAFKWRPMYIIPVVIYPTLMSCIHLTLVFTYDAIQPAGIDDMYCNATKPIWIRLVGLALPLTVSIPFSYLAIISLARVRRILAHIERANRDNNDLPRKIRRDRSSFKGRREEGGEAEPRNSMASSSFPTFAPMPDLTGKPPPHVNLDLVGEGSSAPTSDIGHGDSELDVTIEAIKRDEEEDIDDGGTFRLSYRENALPPAPSRISHIAVVPSHASTIYLLVLFQFLFPLFFLVGSLSTILDVAAKRATPTPFGTHHVALLASAWIPALLPFTQSSVRETVQRTWRLGGR